MIIELHFQEGFSGETIEIIVDGEVRVTFEAKTRYQINLAAIKEIDVQSDQKLEVRLKETGNTIELPTNTNIKYYVISKHLEKISAEPVDQMPKYL